MKNFSSNPRSLFVLWANFCGSLARPLQYLARSFKVFLLHDTDNSGCHMCAPYRPTALHWSPVVNLFFLVISASPPPAICPSNNYPNPPLHCKKLSTKSRTNEFFCLLNLTYESITVGILGYIYI